MLPRSIDAIQFDGTNAGVERVVAWAQAIAPDLPVRPRTEYTGWEDLTGHLELEVKGMETGAMAGDWIIVTSVEEQRSIWLIDERSFAKYYEEIVD